MRNGNDVISSEEHFENSKTSRGSYLDLHVLAIYAPVIYAAPCVMFLMHADTLKLA